MRNYHRPLPDEQNIKFMNDPKRLELEAAVHKVVEKINRECEEIPNMNYGMILNSFEWRIAELRAKVEKLEAYQRKLYEKLMDEAMTATA